MSKRRRMENITKLSEKEGLSMYDDRVGRFTKPSDGKSYNIRAVLEEVRRLNRPLTEEEFKKFENIKNFDVNNPYEAPPSLGINIRELAKYAKSKGIKLNELTPEDIETFKRREDEKD